MDQPTTNSMKMVINNLLFFTFRHNKYYQEHRYLKESYSQEGEDIIVSRFLKDKLHNNGFFIDVGAHHPIRFSNTYLFYKNNWRGINIDATPGSMTIFNRYRPLDINLEYAISDNERIMTFYIFEEAALNTFSRELAEEYIYNGAQLIKKEQIKQHRLSAILEKHLEPGSDIDFMSIDAEGHDLQVLKSNDWEKYNPKIILIEILDFEIEEANNSEIYNYLTELGYKLSAKTYNTLFFTKI